MKKGLLFCCLKAIMIKNNPRIVDKGKPLEIT